MFGERLFGGSSFIFRALAIPLLLFAVGMPFLVQRWTPFVTTLVAILVSAAILLFLALSNPHRFRWAGRLLGGIIFVAYVAYAIDEWFLSTQPFQLMESGAAASLRNALLGLVIIGIPALIYAITGRFSWRRRSSDSIGD